MKIKKVLIDGFRAYESAENGNFDFSMPSGKCADFVAIFAPNGFGKTSFYDAVEYALTGTITRFIREAYRSDYDSKSRAQVQRKSKQYVLRNHALAPSAIARITVTLDINGKEVVEPKEIPKPKSGARDFHFKKNVVSTDYSGIADVFLSQEAIDSFLREEKADARYIRFMSNFADVDEGYRADLAALIRELESELEETRANINKERVIAERPVSLEAISGINDTISELISDSEKLALIDENFNADHEIKILNFITTRTHEISQFCSKNELVHGALSELEVELPNLKLAVETNHSARKALTEFSRRKKVFEERNVAVQAAQLSEASLNPLNERLVLLVSLRKELPSFESAVTQRAAIRKDKLAASSELNKITTDLVSLEKRAKECIVRSTAADLRIEEILRAQKDSGKTYSAIKVKEESIAEGAVQINELRVLIDAVGLRLKNNRKNISSINAVEIQESAINNSDLILISTNDFSPLQLRAAFVEKRAKEIVLQDAEKFLESARLHTTQIGELISLGRALLAEVETSNCPLCTHDHGSNHLLLKAILSNDGLSQNEGFALQSKLDATASLVLASRKVDDLIRLGKEAKESRIAELTVVCERDSILLGEYQNKKSEIETQVAKASDELLKLRLSVLELPYAQFLDKLALDVDLQIKIREAEVADRTICESKIASIRNTQKDLTQAIQALQGQLEAIDASPAFNIIAGFCTANNIAESSINDALKHLTLEVETRISEAKLKLTAQISLIKEIDAIDPTLEAWGAFDASLEEASAKEKLLDSEVIIVPILSKLRQYLDNYQDSWTADEVAVQISHELERIAFATESAKNKMEKLELLGKQLIEVRPYIESLESQKILNGLLVKLKREEALESELAAEYQNTTSQLNDKIQQFFYPDLINSIYKRIDPHPDFKRVEFACDFEDDKPTLEVFVADKDGELISPNLYFSAAQINILSLSIFLARALHAKNGEGQIECILIDDPVHSMDSINVLSTIDLLRSISLKFNRQIILSTHDRNFFELLQKKLPLNQYGSKFLELETFGRVVSAEPI